MQVVECCIWVLGENIYSIDMTKLLVQKTEFKTMSSSLAKDRLLFDSKPSKLSCGEMITA